MVYDVLRKAIIMYVGFYEESWMYDGTSWVEITRTPPELPVPRTGAATAYDPLRGRLVLFGGSAAGGVKLDDTWEWDGDSWTRILFSASVQR